MAQSNEEMVRVQILVDEGLGDELEDLARASDLSVAKTAGMILEAAIEDRTILADWLTAVIAEPVTAVMRKKIKKTGKTFYLQASMSRRVAEKIPEIAARLNQTPSKMSALLLEWGVKDYNWIHRTVWKILRATGLRKWIEARRKASEGVAGPKSNPASLKGKGKSHMEDWIVNGVQLQTGGHCGYIDEEMFDKGSPNGIGVSLWHREDEHERWRTYLRVQSEMPDGRTGDMKFAEEWYEVKGAYLVKVDPERGFKRVR